MFFCQAFVSIDTNLALNDLSVLVEDLIYIGSIRSARKGSIVECLIFNCLNIAYYIRT